MIGRLNVDGGDVYSVRVRTRKAAGESIPVTAAFRRGEVFGFSRGQSIVGEEDDFVGVDFVPVFVLKLLGLDEAGLQQAGDEGTRTSEGVEDMDALAAEGLTELRLQHLVHRVDDEVHHL